MPRVRAKNPKPRMPRRCAAGQVRTRRMAPSLQKSLPYDYRPTLAATAEHFKVRRPAEGLGHQFSVRR